MSLSVEADTVPFDIRFQLLTAMSSEWESFRLTVSCETSEFPNYTPLQSKRPNSSLCFVFLNGRLYIELIWFAVKFLQLLTCTELPNSIENS
jgi:hypothetical protein